MRGHENRPAANQVIDAHDVAGDGDKRAAGLDLGRPRRRTSGDPGLARGGPGTMGSSPSSVFPSVAAPSRSSVGGGGQGGAVDSDAKPRAGAQQRQRGTVT
jgi:hypothetical protein